MPNEILRGEKVLLKRYTTDVNITLIDCNTWEFWVMVLSAIELAQQLCSEALKFSFKYTEKALDFLFAKGIHRLICRILRQWRLRYYNNSLEDCSKKSKASKKLQERKTQVDFATDLMKPKINKQKHEREQLGGREAMPSKDFWTRSVTADMTNWSTDTIGRC